MAIDISDFHMWPSDVKSYAPHGHDKYQWPWSFIGHWYLWHICDFDDVLMAIDTYETK